MTLGVALEVADLQKRYGPTVALDGVSFSVSRGEVHALLGENGAGKSTFVKSLSGLTEPDAGTISIFGEVAEIFGPKISHRLGIGQPFRKFRSSKT